MSSITRMDIVDIELNSGNVHRSWLNHSIGSGDNNANGFGVRLFRNGEPVNIGAGWVQGFFRNSQGENIALTQHGAIAGNEAYVVLPQACYNYDGPFTLAIKLVSEGSTNTVTMRIVDGMVDNTNTDSAVAPTGTVPTYQEILAVYNQLLEDVEDYEEVVANQDQEIDDLKSAIGSPINSDSLLLYNAYDESNALKGYVLSLNTITHILSISPDSRFGISNKIAVPPGYKVWPTGTVNGNRQTNSACRSYYVTDRTGVCIDSGTDVGALSYTNTGDELVFIQYIIFVDHPDTTVTDLEIIVLPSSTPVSPMPYKPFGTLKYNVDNEISVMQENIKNNEISEKFVDSLILYNLYNNNLALKGVTLVYDSVNNVVNEQENANFDTTDYILIPPGYTVFSCAFVNNVTSRSIINSARAYFVYDKNKAYKSHNLDMSVMTYSNTGTEPVYIRYVMFSASNPNYTIYDFVIRMYKTSESDRLKLSRYFDYGTSLDRVLYMEEYNPSNYMVIAHQLGMGLGPGNTLPAFRASVRKGFRYVEFDVQKTLDGKFVLSHDDELWVLTGNIIDLDKNSSSHTTIFISQKNYNSLLSYDFGADYSATFAGTKICLLDDLLLQCKKLDIIPVMDVKYLASEEDVKAIISKFRQYGLDKKAIYTTYYSEAIDSSWHVLEYLIDNLKGCKIQGAAFAGAQDTWADIKAIITSMETHNEGRSNELLLYLDGSLLSEFNDDLIKEDIGIIAAGGNQSSGNMNTLLTNVPNAKGYLINNGYFVGKDLVNYVQNQLWPRV